MEFNHYTRPQSSYDGYSKYIFSCFLFIFYGSLSFAQEEDVFLGELTKMYNEVKSPESKAFEKYGEIGTSLYAGVPEISIPLHTLSGREFSLPISLTYDASGVQVEQMATWVGLSWNLNAGGRITRITNGLPDDYIFGTYNTMFNNPSTRQTAEYCMDNYANLGSQQFDSIQAAIDYAEFVYDINLNRFDTQYDHFKLSAPGINETIVLEWDSSNGFVAKALQNPRLKITYIMDNGPTSYIKTWTVINEDGTQYIFDDRELTQRQNLGADIGPDLMGDANTTYVSAWVLTKIISKNGKDVFDITYSNELYEDERNFASATGSATTTLINNVNYYAEPPGNYSNVVSAVKQRLPHEIFLNSRKMASFILGSRKDVGINAMDTRLASINFLDWDENLLKSVIFNNIDYFNADGLSPANILSSGKSYYDIRLKLNGLTIKGNDDLAYENYIFEYIRPDDLPSRGSFAQDYLGFYNGAGNNNSLFTAYTTDGISFAGGNREPDTFYGTTGTLNKITYPTGGYTEFEYQGHQIYTTNTNFSTESLLSMVLNTSSPTTPELYTNSQGIPCDDKYLAPFHPRIMLKTFTILEEDYYNLSLVSSTNDVEFYLVNPSVVQAPYMNYCDFINSPEANNVLNDPMYFSGNQTIHLPKGKYRALLLLGNLNGAPSVNASVSISRGLSTTTWNNTNIGGQRISEYKNYSSIGNLATKKIFNYNASNGESTGSINYKPVIFSFRSGTTENGSKDQLVRYATFAKGSEPYVVYGSVSESLVNGTNQLLGSTRHNFYKGVKGSVPATTPPYENWYFPNLKVGNLSSKSIYRESDGAILTTEDYDYYETLQRPISIESLVVHVDNDKFQKVPFLKEHNINTSNYYVTFEYLDAFDYNDCAENGTPSSSTGTVWCAVPGYFSNPQNYGYHSYLNAKYAPYVAKISKSNGAYGGQNYYKKESLNYDATGNALPSVVVEENTTYDNDELSPKYLPRKKTVTDSKGNTIETEYSYPHDGVVTGSASLVTKNNLVEVVKTETIMNPGEQNEKPISTVEKSYAAFGSAVLPTSISTTKGGEANIQRGEFDFYSGGNIKSSNMVDGPKTYYIWGYNSEFPIAQISNFDTTDASNLQTLITACTTASNADDGTVPAENALRTALENLRVALPTRSLMTSYTYDPSIGVTSVTDSKGYTTFYEYDGFNRLHNVKDDELNIMSDYQYHYKGQN